MADMRLKVAAVQDAPVFLDRAATTGRILDWLDAAAAEGVRVLAFGETFLPGYPFWLAETDGARFDDPAQKEAYREYLEAAVRIDGPELAQIAERARQRNLMVILGVAERAGGSIHCTAVPIHPERGILAAHRKLVPTYEERLAWAPGDGYGLCAHEIDGVRIGVLNCWENWMPQARHALYADGIDLHVALWPGSVRNTRDITRFIALEGRVFVLSASALLRPGDVPASFSLAAALPRREWFHDGGSAVAGPDGSWIVEPCARERRLVIAELDLAEVARERQTLDCTGHYSRPDVFHVEVDRTRRRAVRFRD